MTKLLDQAMKAARMLTPERQDAMARMMLDMVELRDVEADIPQEDLPDVLAGIAEANRGEFASEAEVEAALRRLRA